MKGRRRWLARCWLLASVLTLALSGTTTAAPADWSAYLHGARHSSYAADATTFTPTAAASLHEDWTFTAAPPTQTGQPNHAFNASPTVSNGVVYLGANTGVFSAIDEVTGGEIWSRNLGYTTAKTCGFGRGITSTATVANDASRGGQATVYVAGGDGYLYALRASDGTVVWRSFVVNIGTNRNTGYDWASPTVIGGRVYMGISSQCDRPLIRGGIREYDQASGALQHTYWSTPQGTVGGSVWTSPASDGTNVWATIGNGDSGDSFAIVRLSASTLAPQERWVVPNTAGTDLDWGSSPTLFDATLSGTSTSMVGGCNKNGVYYALRATDLASGPVWSRRLGKTGNLGAGDGACLAAAIWDFTARTLYAAGNKTTIAGSPAAGSVRALNPATGRVRWATPLAGGPVMGSPTLSGGGVLAAGTYNTSTPGSNAVYLLDASDGTIITTIPETSAIFAQPVFADTHLFVATAGGTLTALTTGP